MNFDSVTSGKFADCLTGLDNEHFSQRIFNSIKSILPQAMEGAGFSGECQFSSSGDKPIEFGNGLIVVKFGDLALRIKDQAFSIGMSATVCQGDHRSKVWSRVSCDSIDLDTESASRQMDFQHVIADAVCSELSSIYCEALSEFSAKTAEYKMMVNYVFLIEAGDYDSDKLFDSITTLRETGNLFVLHDEGDWGPVDDLFKLSVSRMGGQLGIGPIAEIVDDEEIARLSRIFNEEDKALTWEVTLGRHGMFAAEESSVDPTTGASRSRMIGICSQHSAIQNENNVHSPSWMVSGQLAPKLGSNF